MESGSSFERLVDCIRSTLEDDPDCDEIEFHEQGCPDIHGEGCACKPYKVPVDEIHLLGVEVVAKKLEVSLYGEPQQ